MADRQIGVIVDVKSESVKFATDRTIGLREQLRMLKKEQSRLLSIGQEGSKEFTILSNAINNTQDDLERSNQKAKDLFATFSLIPGPVGEFAGKVNGAVSALKLLSGFTIKDIGNQFKEFGKDIGEIGKNIKNFGLDLLGLRLKPDITNELSKAQNSTKALSASVAESTAQVNANTVSENVNTASTLENSLAQDKSRDSKIQDVQATNLDTKAVTTNTLAVAESTIQKEREYLAFLKSQKSRIENINITDAESKAILLAAKQREIDTQQQKINNLETQKSTLTTQANTVAENTNTVAENVNTVSNTTNTLSRRALTIAIAQQTAFTRVLTTAMTALGVSEYYAATAALALKAALRAIGIGILIQLASVLIGKLMDLIPFFNETSDATKKAADNTEAYTKALDRNSQALEKNLQQIDYQTKKKKLLAEINGSSAKEILKITQNGLEQEKQLYSKQIGDLQALRAKASKDSKLTAEERAKTLDSIDKKIVEASKNYVKKREEIEFAGLEYAKTIAEQRRKDSETATDLLLDLQNKFNVQTAKNARDKEDIELQIQKEAEEKKIKALDISNARKLELLKQLNANYAAIVLQNAQKRNEEDAKIAADNLQKALDFQRQRATILVQATGDEIKEQKEQRRQKYEDDLKALKENTEFLKMGIIDRAILLLALQKKYNADLKKIDDDKRKQDNDDLIKKLDDELKFLQIANEAKVEGTKAFYDGQRQILDLAQKRELAQLDLTEDQKTRIKEKYVKLRKDLDKQELNSYLQMATALLGAASNIVSDIAEVNQLQMEVDLQKAGDNAEKQEEIKKKYFEKNKKTQIAQAIIGTLQAAIQAYQSLAVIPVVGPALGAVAAAAALVFGYKKVDLIKQQQYQSSTMGSSSVDKPAMANYGRNYEKGGYIDGPRHAQGGVMIEAEGGEAVMTRGAVTMFAPLLSAMNQIGGGTSFQPGAVGAPRPDAPLLNKPAENQAPLIMKTYVVENELTTIQQRQARLKDLSTL